jgi:4-amino-4-deoxy-L-arabinose transferase-like glycosyltransferase
MRAIIAVLALFLVVGIMLFVPTLAAPYEAMYGKVTAFECAKALGICAAAALIAGYLINRDREHGAYLVKLFMLALMVRIVIGAGIFVFNGQDFFGGDAWTYDFIGQQQLAVWQGDKYAKILVEQFIGPSYYSGWGMVYMVAGIYGIVGRNMLAVQFFNAVLGAATAPLIFLCVHEVFKNRRVAVVAAIAVGFYPSLVLWSSQGLKDGPIVFFLVLSILATLRLGKKLSAVYLAVLVAALFGVLAFRFYVFYMLVAAIGGAFVMGMRAVTAQSLARQFVIVITLGLSFTYLGVTRYASLQFERYGSMEAMQRSRLDAATTAESGFAKDVDVSTTSGALSTIPLGIVYLLFAPFPWQLTSLRQSLTLPEMIVWWAAFPLLVLGAWFSIRNRLRQMSPILMFTSMLTLAYSVFQGNVGTAYRQRSQLLVFYFIFVAVGVMLLKEKQEERRKRAAEELSSANLRLKATLLQRSPGQRA